jgi:HEPN domain-containing protein
MITDPQNPRHWLLLAQERLEKADALFEQFGSSYSGVELLQEAVERFLKGYLVAKGWRLVRTHNLPELVAEAAGYDGDFKRFLDFAASLTQQFWEQHYPGGDLTEVGSDYTDLRQQAGELVALVLASVS